VARSHCRVTAQGDQLNKLLSSRISKGNPLSVWSGHSRPTMECEPRRQVAFLSISFQFVVQFTLFPYRKNEKSEVMSLMAWTIGSKCALLRERIGDSLCATDSCIDRCSSCKLIIHHDWMHALRIEAGNGKLRRCTLCSI